MSNIEEAQRAFTQIRDTILVQGKPCTNYAVNACRYHNEDGDRCAIGALISPAVYSEDLEGLSGLSDRRMRKALVDSGFPHEETYRPMLYALQAAHDRASTGEHVLNDKYVVDEELDTQINELAKNHREGSTNFTDYWIQVTDAIDATFFTQTHGEGRIDDTNEPTTLFTRTSSSAKTRERYLAALRKVKSNCDLGIPFDWEEISSEFEISTAFGSACVALGIVKETSPSDPEIPWIDGNPDDMGLNVSLAVNRAARPPKPPLICADDIEIPEPPIEDAEPHERRYSVSDDPQRLATALEKTNELLTQMLLRQ